MFQLDPYRECLNDNGKFSRAAYCIVDVYIKPNASSQLWNIIQRNSEPWKTQYRHDRLVYGICVNRCRKLLSKFDKMTQKQYLSSKPISFEDYLLDPFTFRHAIEDKIEFGKIVNECINYEMKKQHQLEAYAEIQYCDVDSRMDGTGK